MPVNKNVPAEIIGREGLNNGKLVEMGMADNHAENTFHKNNVSA